MPDGARLVQISALNGGDGREVDFSPAEIERLMADPPAGGAGEFLHKMYAGMLFDNKAFKELFRALEAGETPILFHCSAGKDRTGTAAMLILLALGADDATICADFARTNLCRKADIDALLARYAPQIAEDPAREAFYRGIAGVDPEMAPYVLGLLREKYGSAEGYLEAEYGLTPARLMRLRRMYLE